MAIETLGLTKQYGGKGGCVNINLKVERGEIFGFLGPNGAGKSTLVKTLVGLLRPTSGTASILGRPLGDTEVKGRIGYLPENFRYHDWMTGLEVMRFHAELYKMSRPERRITELLELVGLAGHEKKRVAGYSKGMQQRLGLAVALLPDPELVFLDEPTSALDPVGRIEVREIIRELKNRGKTVFLNSHLLSEVEMVCDRVAVINKGRIIIQGSLKDMLYSGSRVLIRTETPAAGLIEALSAAAEEIEQKGEFISLKVKYREDIPAIARIIVESGTPLYELKVVGGSLEELFVNLLRGGKTGDNGNEVFV
ncbi:ABC transporter ATP-binding protein [Thermosediminibacter litoriperuensis]|uniref:ABC-2 type transport system ATP-binding protein n=1 Tax=Thermosediminibacter litoriperuensis TaxID=291989 RepID=A0A5S5AV06_9FIRM|nr:ABC transporter ATP-binding protein [Thermosediminibacter litoriperuensis]TYP56720.1 ABC-2 type transport system ATP-binding protein [Thermosediminibacter litoriperuensis]